LYAKEAQALKRECNELAEATGRENRIAIACRSIPFG